MSNTTVISVRVDEDTARVFKEMLVSRRLSQADLIREMIQKEAAGGVSDTLSSVGLSVDAVQDRLAEVENELVQLRQNYKEQEVLMLKTLTEASFSTYMWRISQTMKSPEEITALQAGFDEYFKQMLEG